MSSTDFDKNALVSILTLLKVTSAGGRSTLVPLTHVYFDGQWAFSYDGQHVTRVPFASALKISAPLASLLALATNGKSKKLSVTLSENGSLEWKCGRNRGRWESLQVQEWPLHMDVFELFTQQSTSPEDQALATAMRAVIPRVAEVASPDDHARTPGILVKVNSKQVFACATDNIRVGMAYVTGTHTKAPAIGVPGSFAKVLKNAPVDGLQLYQSENWMGLRFSEGHEVFSRLIALVDGQDYGVSLLRRLSPSAYRIVVDDAFVLAVKSINDLGKDVRMTITVEQGQVFLQGKSKIPQAELDLETVMMTRADVADSSDEELPNISATFYATHLLKLLTPDASVYLIDSDVGPVALIDGHGAHFVVGAISEDAPTPIAEEE
jgi:hypothetical protein